MADVRVLPKGDVAAQVIEGGYEAMRAVPWKAARLKSLPVPRWPLKYDDPDKTAPITESQVLAARRLDDNYTDLWSVFNHTQENLIRGGLVGRGNSGRR